MSEILQLERPPVTEAIISLQFAPLKFSNIHAGALMQDLAALYPVTSEHPPLTPQFEMFGGKSSMGAGAPFPFQLNFGAPFVIPSRYWFEKSDKSEILQFQNDRIIHNWKRNSINQDYPSYKILKDRFCEDLKIVSTYIKNSDLGEIIPNQCEVSYINVIPFSEPDSEIKNTHDVTPLLSSELLCPDGLRFEGTALQSRFIIIDAAGEPCGRVHVAITPETDEQGKVTRAKLDICARGLPPKNGGLESALDFLDILHDKAIAVFKTVTANGLRDFWGVTSHG